MLKDIFVYFENDVLIKASGFGAKNLTNDYVVGEAIFNTSLTGYQEIITDPSYAGQFIVFCMPEIGIVGCNEQDMESRQTFARGIIVRNINIIKSNFRAKQNLLSFCQQYNLVGICNIDTRSIVKMLRDNGSMMMIVSYNISNKESLRKILKSEKNINQMALLQEVSTKHTYIHKECVFNFDTFDYALADDFDSNMTNGNQDSQRRKKIVAIDFGIKRNILNELSEVGLFVEVIPHDFDPNDLVRRYISKEIGGIFLSNGPGNPQFLQNEIEKIKILIEAKIPIFGICLGHQLLSNAFGYPTYKLKFGQHGGNHPVKNMQTNVLEITAQNHNYNVPESISEVAIITHRNLFDNTIEGVRYKNYPIFSLQYHPESSPGPREARNIFLDFAKIVDFTLDLSDSKGLS
ncbi:carbamoyl-phosphate synthase small subunit [Helicobacter muridarum]|uniref:Carbamoyl phosphate synthase small chain n=1 Tax=Helicobacter muridarum TaxID=216 RepID=A0A377PXJ2_9HELI|nr:glutamine-hydrolyzing carbamoyl-phosphate synthase small subunit [Helicobacter muridarum]TLE01314.1 carbamoyl-phosphate synthase small subunit [Helicobacter muridarum]STQ87184.1 carbamoyl phosphate synthase small subunit [Helicobacter muridarum]